MLSDGALVTDSQVHVWSSDQRRDPRALGRSRRALDARDILAEMSAAGVDHAVLVPPSAAGDDNSAALDAATRFPHRFAVMGRVPLAAGPSAVDLAGWHAQAGMLGVRLTFTSVTAKRSLRDGTADWFWPAAERHGIPVMVACGHDVDAIEVQVARHPGLRIAIDHMGLEVEDRDAAVEQAVDRLLPLARYTNLCVKASAVPAYLTPHYPLARAFRQVSRLIDAYGPERIFWGSDLSRLSTSYGDLVSAHTHHLGLGRTGTALVMGGALRSWLGWNPS